MSKYYLPSLMNSIKHLEKKFNMLLSERSSVPWFDESFTSYNRSR